MGSGRRRRAVVLPRMAGAQRRRDVRLSGAAGRTDARHHARARQPAARHPRPVHLRCGRARALRPDRCARVRAAHDDERPRGGAQAGHHRRDRLRDRALARGGGTHRIAAALRGRRDHRRRDPGPARVRPGRPAPRPVPAPVGPGHDPAGARAAADDAALPRGPAARPGPRVLVRARRPLARLRTAIDHAGDRARRRPAHRLRLRLRVPHRHARVRASGRPGRARGGDRRRPVRRGQRADRAGRRGRQPPHPDRRGVRLRRARVGPRPAGPAPLRPPERSRGRRRPRAPRRRAAAGRGRAARRAPRSCRRDRGGA